MNLLLEYGFWGRFFLPIWAALAAIIIGYLFGNNSNPEPDLRSHRQREDKRQ